MLQFEEMFRTFPNASCQLLLERDCNYDEDCGAFRMDELQCADFGKGKVSGMKTEAATIYGGGSSQEYDHCDRCKGDYPVGQSKVVKAWRDTGGWTFVDSIVHLL